MTNLFLHTFINMSTQKTLHITDSDLDGVGSILLSQACGIHYDKVMISNPRAVNSDSTVTTAMQYDKIIVTDLSFNENVLNQLLKAGKTVFIYDHHKTSEYLNKYQNCISDTSRCGTKLYFEEVICNDSSAEITESIYKFVELVDTYDRWQTDSEHWLEACELSKIFMFYASSVFIKKYANKLKRNTLAYDDEDKIALKQITSLINNAYKYAETNMKIHEIDGVRAAITRYKEFCSEVGNALVKAHNLTYVILINAKYVGQASVRSVHDFDCTTLKGFCGHKNAAGGKFDPNYLEDLYRNW
jgi:oligoribonuclease NrnB/cAMP/cGMP phosphodiesterase (DHH superfamily)